MEIGLAIMVSAATGMALHPIDQMDPVTTAINGAIPTIQRRTIDHQARARMEINIDRAGLAMTLISLIRRLIDQTLVQALGLLKDKGLGSISQKENGLVVVPDATCIQRKSTALVSMN
jgi:hypothetical protein